MINKLAFYYDSTEIPLLVILEGIKNYLYSQNNYDDFTIFTNIMFSLNTEYAMVPTFYHKFFKGTVIFFDLEDYLAQEDIRFCHNLLYIHDLDKFKTAYTSIDIKKINMILYNENSDTKYEVVYANKL